MIVNDHKRRAPPACRQKELAVLKHVPAIAPKRRYLSEKVPWPRSRFSPTHSVRSSKRFRCLGCQSHCARGCWTAALIADEFGADVRKVGEYRGELARRPEQARRVAVEALNVRH